MDPHTQAWADQSRARLTSTIRRYGWAIQYVGGGCCSRPGCDGGNDNGPPFAYTVGLFGLGHPELLVFGLPPPAAATVLNGFGERIRDGEQLIPHQLLTLEGTHHRFVPEEVPNPGEIVFAANRFYRRPDRTSVEVLQLTYDDGRGLFPWDNEYALPETQPRPGTFRA